jgi:acetoin utilization deacetylase AcuC-like enzyme
MGFCYFNNIAIAARYLQQQWGLERIAIVDVDVHHGNGTQHIFEQDPSVFYFSVHEHPSFAYPGTGREFEMGVAGGNGFTRNCPILPGKDDDAYREALDTQLAPEIARFNPQVILLSTGFDAHRDDEMSDMRVTTDGFTHMARTIFQWAEAYAGGRLLSILEGGYCLERLPELGANHVRILLDI